MNKSFSDPVMCYISLTKPVITLSVAFSALTAWVLASEGFTHGWLPMYIGVILIAAGSSALNHIQERDIDKLMHRTQRRPLPAGKISLLSAQCWAWTLSLAGALTLYFFSGPIPCIVAILTLIWYNGIYTPLKRRTPWAIFPGAVVGALPPVIGWTAAGADITHPHIVILAFFFFIGQIPHFWLILLRHGKDYETAGFPSVARFFSQQQISRLTFIWTSITAIAATGLWIFGIIQLPVAGWILLLTSLGIIFAFRHLLQAEKPVKVNRAFMLMNMYFLGVMILIMADATFRNFFF